MRLRKQLSISQRGVVRPDFAESENLRRALEEKEQVLTRLQRENSELTRGLKASCADEGDSVSTSVKVQESCHKVDELSELSWGKESMIKHSKPQLGERLRSLQNIQKELEESGRQVSMLEAQLGNLGAVDRFMDQKTEVENPNENLRLKQETVQQLSWENKRLRPNLEDTNEGEKLVEDMKGKINDLTIVLDLKREALCHFYELQNGKESDEARSAELEQDVLRFTREMDGEEDKYQLIFTDMEKLFLHGQFI